MTEAVIAPAEEKKSPPLAIQFANVNGRFYKVKDQVPLPGDSRLVTREDVEAMTDEDLGKIYGEIAATSPKRFSTREVAIKSLLYQVSKMPEFDPSRPAPASAAKQGKSPKEKKEKAPKVPATYEVLAPLNAAEQLAGLAPQAQELFKVLVDLAHEVGSPLIAGEVLEKHFELPRIKEQLKTRQEAIRILGYYRRALEEHGLLRVSR